MRSPNKRLQPIVEPLVPTGRSAFSLRRISVPTFHHPFHYHAEFEITWIEKSSGTYLIGETLGEFRADDLFLLGSNLPHIFRNPPDAPQGAAAEVLHFHPGPAESHWLAMPDMAALVSLMARANGGLMLRGAGAMESGRLLRMTRLSHGVERVRAFCDLIAALLQATEWSVIGSSSFRRPAMYSRNQRGESRIARVCGEIMERYSEPITHSEMAALACLSPGAFSRTFKRVTGRTFTEFLTEIRLTHACRLIASEEKTILSAAFEVGFSNLAHFNRCFRTRYGCTPSAYRKRLWEEV